MKVGDLVQVAWSLPMYAPAYNGKRGTIIAISNGGLIAQVLFDRADGGKIKRPIPDDCLKVLTPLDLLAEV